MRPPFTDEQYDALLANMHTPIRFAECPACHCLIVDDPDKVQNHIMNCVHPYDC